MKYIFQILLLALLSTSSSLSFAQEQAVIKPAPQSEINDYKLQLFTNHCLKPDPNKNTEQLDKISRHKGSPRPNVTGWHIYNQYGVTVVIITKDSGLGVGLTCEILFQNANLKDKIENWLHSQYPNDTVINEGHKRNFMVKNGDTTVYHIITKEPTALDIVVAHSIEDDSSQYLTSFSILKNTFDGSILEK